MIDPDTDDSVNDDALPAGKGGKERQTTANGHDNDGEVEARARRMGWRPPDEFDESMVGKPKKMLSAKEYVEKVESDLPILRERNRFLDTTVSKLETKLQESSGLLKSTNERVSELGTLVEDLHRQSIEVGKRAYEKGRRELQAEIDAAVRDGNPDAVRQLTSEMVELERRKPVDPPARQEQKPKTEERPAAQPAKLSDAAQSWIKDNGRIMSDPILNPVAVALHTQNLNSGMSEDESFEKLKSQVMAEMPHKFENQRRNDPAAVAGSSAPARTSKKKGFDALPDDAKQTYQRMKKFFAAKGKDYKQDEFAKGYWLNLENNQ